MLPKPLLLPLINSPGCSIGFGLQDKLRSDPGADYYEQQYRERMVNNLKKKARLMGFELVAQPEVNEGVS